jgi:aryl-alcohol dehydrogenase-like predicted oxidoreductase
VESDAIRTGHLALESGINFIDVCLLNWLTEAETVLVKALKGISPNKYYLATKVERPPVLDPLWQPGKSGNN